MPSAPRWFPGGLRLCWGKGVDGRIVGKGGRAFSFSLGNFSVLRSAGELLVFPFGLVFVLRRRD